jgi:biopolymer transport protein ExbD
MLLILAVFLWSAPSGAQTIQVDITPAHATNHFAPNQTLGAGVDRIPQ